MYSNVLVFETMVEPKRLLKVDFAKNAVDLDGLPGALLYSSAQNLSMTAYLYVSGQMYEFKYEQEPNLGFLIRKQKDFDEICLFKLKSN